MDFIAFRSETVRLGREVSTEAANAQGNNDLNRANRKALNDLLVAFSKRNEAAGSALAEEANTFTATVNWLMPLVLLIGLAGSFVIALIFGQRSIAPPDPRSRRGDVAPHGRRYPDRCAPHRA